jgi:hypothetical protein
MHATCCFESIVEIFGPESSRFQTVSIGDNRSLIFFQTHSRDRRQDQPHAVVTAVRAENRPTIPFPTSGCAAPGRSIQEVGDGRSGP